MCAGGLVVKLVKARSSERHASSAQVGPGDRGRGHARSARVRSPHAPLPRSLGASSLSPACGTLRRVIEAERARCRMGRLSWRAHKMRKRDAVRPMSPQVGTLHSGCGPHTLFAACMRASPSPGEVRNALRAVSRPPCACHSRCCCCCCSYCCALCWLSQPPLSPSPPSPPPCVAALRARSFLLMLACACCRGRCIWLRCFSGACLSRSIWLRCLVGACLSCSNHSYGATSVRASTDPTSFRCLDVINTLLVSYSFSLTGLRLLLFFY